MRKYLCIAPNFTISAEIIKGIKRLIKGQCAHSKLFITLGGITNDESETVLKHIASVGDYKITSEYDYHTTEGLLEFEYFYCGGQVKPDTGINLVHDVYKANGNESFDYSDYCPICRNGYKQIAALVVKGLSAKYAPKKFLAPYWTYWVVASGLWKKIIARNITGVDFWELASGHGGKIS